MPPPISPDDFLPEVATRPDSREAAPELATPLYTSTGNRGYVHAPSLAHATTAAILRAGYPVTEGTRAKRTRSRSTSARSECAQHGGCWRACARGSRSARCSATASSAACTRTTTPISLLDRYIPSFRALSPQPGDPSTPAQVHGAAESISARNVVDGLVAAEALSSRLRAPLPRRRGAPRRYHSGRHGAADRNVVCPSGPVDRDFRAIDEELHASTTRGRDHRRRTVAEAVHQIAQGNSVRAGAALEAIALGEAPPPELQVIETPRTGIGLTHRLIVLFSGVPTASWSAPTPRAAAEPFLSAWASQLLGVGAGDAVCRVAYVNDNTAAPLLNAEGQPITRDDIRLRSLGLSPLDVLYLPDSQGEAQASELEQRIAYYALQAPPAGVRPPDLPATAGVRLGFTRQSDWPAGTLSVAEVLEAARTARRLITSARALTPADLALPDATMPPSGDSDDPPLGEPVKSPERLLRLKFRADTAVDRLRGKSGAGLITAIPAERHNRSNPILPGALLLRLAAFGVPGSVPLSPFGSDPISRRTLHSQTLSVSREVGERLARLDAMKKGYVGTTPADTRNYHVARLHEVFGQDFRVLPRFTPVDPVNLGRTFAASTALQDSRPLEVVAWLQRAARVRAGAFRLDAAPMYAEALGGGPTILKVGQLPVREEKDRDKDRWVGLRSATGRTLGGRLSLVAHAPVPIDTTRPLAGLLVDEWVEVVPSADETTGLTFHFNRPNARAPQAILLAVPPDERAAWDVETLEATVSETLELAKLRTVDLAALSEVEEYLPAIYIAEPSSEQTVGTDMRRMASGEGPA